MPPETQRQSRDSRTIRFHRNKCYDGENYGPAYDQQVVEVREDWARFFVRRGDAEYVDEDEVEETSETSGSAEESPDEGETSEEAEEDAAEEDQDEEEPGAPTFDTVNDLREAIAEIEDPDQVRAIRDAEAEGDDRVTAIEACEERIAELEDKS